MNDINLASFAYERIASFLLHGDESFHTFTSSRSHTKIVTSDMVNNFKKSIMTACDELRNILKKNDQSKDSVDTNNDELPMNELLSDASLIPSMIDEEMLYELSNLLKDSRTSERWIVHHNRDPVLAAKAAVQNQKLLAKRKYVPIKNGRASLKSAHVYKAIDDLIMSSVFHGNDVHGRPVHFELLGNLDVSYLREKHEIRSMYTYKQYEATFYETVAFDYAWLSHVVDVIGRNTIEEIVKSESTLDGWESQKDGVRMSFASSEWNRFQELARRHLENKRPDKMITIIDMANTGREHLSTFVQQFCKKLGEIATKRTPDRASRIIVLNSPSALRFLWKLMKKMVNPHISKIVEMKSSDESMQTLSEIIPRNKLPSIYGGGCDCNCTDSTSKYQQIKMKFLEGACHFTPGTLLQEILKST